MHTSNAITRISTLKMWPQTWLLEGTQRSRMRQGMVLVLPLHSSGEYPYACRTALRNPGSRILVILPDEYDKAGCAISLTSISSAKRLISSSAVMARKCASVKTHASQEHVHTPSRSTSHLAYYSKNNVDQPVPLPHHTCWQPTSSSTCSPCGHMHYSGKFKRFKTLDE